MILMTAILLRVASNLSQRMLVVGGALIVILVLQVLLWKSSTGPFIAIFSMMVGAAVASGSLLIAWLNESYSLNMLQLLDKASASCKEVSDPQKLEPLNYELVRIQGKLTVKGKLIDESVPLVNTSKCLKLERIVEICTGLDKDNNYSWKNYIPRSNLSYQTSWKSYDPTIGVYSLT